MRKHSCNFIRLLFNILIHLYIKILICTVKHSKEVSLYSYLIERFLKNVKCVLQICSCTKGGSRQHAMDQISPSLSSSPHGSWGSCTTGGHVFNCVGRLFGCDCSDLCGSPSCSASHTMRIGLTVL